ncbi:hypothetical protein AVEN_67178-1 [Araneus ventricosus]|uniref:Uncharacterized protein n=1 Tax=Araneus ventricosus TaxID=182803 RepID=A0A4Y2T3Y9_ARAVE|nr:hypothetical protein AVEN_67178-1 [Araneus ventricosus]
MTNEYGSPNPIIYDPAPKDLRHSDHRLNCLILPPLRDGLPWAINHLFVGPFIIMRSQPSCISVLVNDDDPSRFQQKRSIVVFR